jgi:hypothetical protein
MPHETHVTGGGDGSGAPQTEQKRAAATGGKATPGGRSLGRAARYPLLVAEARPGVECEMEQQDREQRDDDG